MVSYQKNDPDEIEPKIIILGFQISGMSEGGASAPLFFIERSFCPKMSPPQIYFLPFVEWILKVSNQSLHLNKKSP